MGHRQHCSCETPSRRSDHGPYTLYALQSWPVDLEDYNLSAGTLVLTGPVPRPESGWGLSGARLDTLCCRFCFLLLVGFARRLGRAVSWVY